MITTNNQMTFTDKDLDVLKTALKDRISKCQREIEICKSKPSSPLYEADLKIDIDTCESLLKRLRDQPW